MCWFIIVEPVTPNTFDNTTNSALLQPAAHGVVQVGQQVLLHETRAMLESVPPRRNLQRLALLSLAFYCARTPRHADRKHLNRCIEEKWYGSECSEIQAGHAQISLWNSTCQEIDEC